MERVQNFLANARKLIPFLFVFIYKAVNIEILNRADKIKLTKKVKKVIKYT